MVKNTSYKSLPTKKLPKADRERAVLFGLIELFLKTGRPIGSQTIQEQGFESIQEKEQSEIEKALKTVEDPELHIDVVTLGLIYDIKEENKDIKITMTFTSPMCPYGPQLMQAVKKKVQEVKPKSKVDIELTFEPVWQPTEEVKTLLGLA